ncbi:MAG: metallophosphoesterase [Ignavibacteria bacterium]|nr:metallophosphoesterase [Ignavibacteria bacterium]
MKMFFRLIFILLIIIRADAQDFKFVVWGDSQFQNPEVFESIVNQTELLKPALVLHVGDMIHGYTYDINVARRQWKRFQKQITPLTSPFYPTPGNHDVTTKEIQPAYLEAWGNDKLYYSFDYANSHFIILNAYLHQNFDSVSIVQLNWLKEDLDKSKNSQNVFVSIHSPLHLNKSYDWSYVHNLLKQYNVRAVFTGHYHYYDYRKIDGIEYFCLNSSGNMSIYNPHIGYSHHFLQINVSIKDVSYAVITNGEIFPKNFVDNNERSRAELFFDENKSVTIPKPSDVIQKTKVSIPLENRSNEKRDYTLSWEVKNYNWSFDSWGKNLSLYPKEKIELDFEVVIPKGDLINTDLPRLKIESPYKTLRGVETSSISYVGLFVPPVCSVKEKKSSFTFDGNVKESIWNETISVDKLFIDYQKNPAHEQTTISIFYDDVNLYIGIKGEEPNPKNLSAYAYGEIPLVFGDDDFELYFDTNRDMKTFYRLMVNPAGTVLSSSPKGRFTFYFEVKIFIADNYWSAEFIIPFSELETKKPERGINWGFNVRRHRQQAEPNQSDWSKMAIYPPYEPEHFGLLVFE